MKLEDFPRPTRTTGEVRWAWVYGAVLGAAATWVSLRMVALRRGA